MDYAENNINDIFTDYESDEIPSEYDPFCNGSENSSYREPYSDVLPAFFFRNKKCGKKPYYHEKKQLRYFYNTTGVILSAKLMIEAACCLLFYILMFLCAFSLTPSLSLYYSALSDTTVRYAFRTIAVIISTLSVFFAGCRYSSVSPGRILKKCRTIKTLDIIVFFMAGIFIAAIQNIINIMGTELHLNAGFNDTVIEKNITQITITAIYTCIVSPVADGLIFRGLALKNLSRASQRFGILASSFLCALASCSLTSMIPVFLMSVVLSKLTVKYNTILPSVFIHMAVNLSGLIISVYGVYAWDSDLLITKIWTIITLVIGAVFAFMLIVSHPLPKNRPEQKRRSLPLFLTSVFIMLLIPLYIVASLAKMLAFLFI